MKTYSLLFILILSSLPQCTSLLETDPMPYYLIETKIDNLETAAQVLDGAYATFSEFGDIKKLIKYFWVQGNSVDEIISGESEYKEYRHMYWIESDLPYNGWQALIQYMNTSLVLFKYIPTIHAKTVEEQKLKQTLLGEAYFLRAFTYYHMAFYWGKVPIYKEPVSDLTTYPLIPCTPAEKIWPLVLTDLTKAEELLPEIGRYEELDGPIRPNKWAVTAFLARIHLILRNWQEAAKKASEVINCQKYVLESDYSLLYKGTNRENIFELYQTPRWPDYNYHSTGWYIVNPEISNLLTPRSGDLRKNASIAFLSNDVVGPNLKRGIYPIKYRYRGHVIFLRLAEMYLNRAEARVHIGDINGALSDINQITQRAKKNAYSTNSVSLLLEAIDTERRLEFCFEGHRLRDILRTQDWNEPSKNLFQTKLDWPAHKRYLPMPKKVLALNPQFQQNPGY